eukprot:g7834.t1
MCGNKSRGLAGSGCEATGRARSNEMFVIFLLFAFVVGALCCQYSTAQGAENCIERVIVDLVLAQVTLSGMGLDPISIGIWTLISLGLCFGLCSSEAEEFVRSDVLDEMGQKG